MKLQSVKKILCATDLSEESEKAVEFAASLASGLKGAQLVLISVIKPIPAYSEDFGADSSIMESEAELKNKRENEISEIVQGIKKEGVTNVTGIVTIGDPVLKILEMSKEIKADLIILGNRKRGFTKGIFLGSVSERVASNSSVSVLIVR
ncbi:MAG: universal stress protein [Candidatus Thermoplasmatota archaeon]|nr:universal stress protein [Candidatus Thermoplasmatota archaeon]MCL5665792.1 universal stress protein [Candidatus Thermoplasmatota archaeon]